MTVYEESSKIRELLADVSKVVLVQPDNPDTDSLASALALEQILHELGKDPLIYSGIDLPSYLRFLSGSDRVTNELPGEFDLSIIIDTSSDTLLGQLKANGQRGRLAARPCIIMDHHATQPSIDFASVILNKPAVATGEIIYELAVQLKWPLNLAAKKMLAIAILSDSLGLTSEGTTARSVHIIGELVEGGVNLAELDNARRETMRREPELIGYKGRLLQRVEFYGNGQVAFLSIPWEEIEKYSPLYNPPMLVLDDMRLAKGVAVAICLKVYPSGKITAKIRSNYGYPIAGQLAERFGGGGHAYASGFKLENAPPLETLKVKIIEAAVSLLDEEKTRSSGHETL